jgi:hypothetical protein
MRQRYILITDSVNCEDCVALVVHERNMSILCWWNDPDKAKLKY